MPSTVTFVPKSPSNTNCAFGTAGCVVADAGVTGRGVPALAVPALGGSVGAATDPLAEIEGDADAEVTGSLDVT